MYGGSLFLGSATGIRTIDLSTYGNFKMTGGLFDATLPGGVITSNIYGNCSFSNTAAMIGIGSPIVFHLALPGTTGMMLIDNTSSGVWSGTNVFVDTGCIARLDDNFNTSTDTSNGLTVYGSLICPAPYAINGSGLFSLSPGATLKVANTSGINGNITTTGAKTFSTNANYEFNGVAAQVTGSFLPATLSAPDTITINNNAGVTLSKITSTTGTLLFKNGILFTGSNSVSIPGGPLSVVGAGATAFVNGTLIKTISGLSTVSFEVGNGNYAPMELTLSSPGTGGSIGVETIRAIHPAIGTSGIVTSNMVNHYWTITDYSASGPVKVTPKATYDLSNIIGGSNASFVTQNYSGGTWLGAPLAAANTIVPYTSKTTTGISLAALPGDYIFGNACGSPVIGPTTVCAGSAISLSDAAAGGAWSSSNTAIATVSGAGVVTGVAAGSAVIVYSKAGCSISTVVNVGTLPITGPVTVCSGSAITLNEATPGGTWSSSNTGVATISATGLVTGVSPGTASISYTSGSCPPVGLVITVTSLPGITGITTLCSGTTATLSNATTGGVWSSSNTTVATISGTGLVSAIVQGITDISYQSGACSVAVPVSVIAIAPVAGDGSVCTGLTITLSDVTTGGVWSSNNTQVATISGTGVVNGVNAGNAVISYVAKGCLAYTQVMVNPSDAGKITGKDSLCIGAANAITLADSVSCGRWSSFDTLRATVTDDGGLVTGMSSGIDTIMYTCENTCGLFTSEFVIYIRPVVQCTSVNVPKALAGQQPELNIFPNPNSGIFRVDLLSGTDEELRITITNLLGQKVKEVLTKTNKKTDVHLDTPGIYVVNVITKNGSYVSRVTVE